MQSSPALIGKIFDCTLFFFWGGGGLLQVREILAILGKACFEKACTFKEISAKIP